jgi:hypothetical protein
MIYFTTPAFRTRTEQVIEYCSFTLRIEGGRIDNGNNDDNDKDDNYMVIL